MNEHERQMVNEYIGKRLNSGSCAQIIAVEMSIGDNPKPYIVYGTKNVRPHMATTRDKKRMFMWLERNTDHRVL